MIFHISGLYIKIIPTQVTSSFLNSKCSPNFFIVSMTFIPSASADGLDFSGYGQFFSPKTILQGLHILQFPAMSEVALLYLNFFASFSISNKILCNSFAGI